MAEAGELASAGRPVLLGLGLKPRQVDDHQMSALLDQDPVSLESAEVLVDALAGRAQHAGQILLRQSSPDTDSRGAELLSMRGQEAEEALGDPRRERQAGQVVGPGGEAAQT